MGDKQAMQADGGGAQPGAGKETEGQMRSGGQSGGAPYPNDAPSAEEGGFLGEIGLGTSESPAAEADAKDAEPEAHDRAG